LADRESGFLLQDFLFFVGGIRMVDVLHHPTLQDPDRGLWKSGSSSAFLRPLFPKILLFDRALVTQTTQLLSSGKTTKHPFVIFSYDV
jgi:hypothetical protein